jgi:hypothetical protein
MAEQRGARQPRECHAAEHARISIRSSARKR